MTVNPDVALVLSITDLETLMSAVDAQDTTLIRMQTGRAPTPGELALITGASVTDLESARDLMKLRMDAMSDSTAALQRVAAFYVKYPVPRDRTMQGLLSEMTPEDQAVCRQAISDAAAADARYRLLGGELLDGTP